MKTVPPSRGGRQAERLQAPRKLPWRMPPSLRHFPPRPRHFPRRPRHSPRRPRCVPLSGKGVPQPARHLPRWLRDFPRRPRYLSGCPRRRPSRGRNSPAAERLRDGRKGSLGALLHQVEQRRRVVKVDSRAYSPLAAAPRGQLHRLSRRPTTPSRQGLAQGILEDGGQGLSATSRHLLGFAKESFVEANRGPHASKHRRQASESLFRLAI